MLKAILSGDDLHTIVGNKYDNSEYETIELTGFTDDWMELFTYDSDNNTIPEDLVDVFMMEIAPVSVKYLGDDKYEVIIDDYDFDNEYIDQFNEVEE